MACGSDILQELLKSCEKNKGGTGKLWAINYDHLSAITENSNHVITGVTFSGAVRFEEIELAKDGALVDHGFVIDAQKDIFATEPTLTIFMNRIDTDRRNWVQDNSGKKVAFLELAMTGIYWLHGVNANGATNTKSGGLSLDPASKASGGRTLADGSTLEIVFKGSEPIMSREVSSSLISSMIA